MGKFTRLRLLLDTHVFLWSLLEPERLHTRVAPELENPANELWLSPVTTWETLVLAERGRIILDANPVSWIQNVLKTLPFHEATLNHQVAIQSQKIALPHQDPIDRFLAATAIVFDMTLVTSDERLLHSHEVNTLSNR